jgi:hypothetical protein
VRAREVYNCSYSEINQLLADSRLPLISLKHEFAEMALIRVPEPLRDIGVTVMCGPFFSLMPFPSLSLHTLSHVRYTPHSSWEEHPGQPLARTASRPLPRPTNYLRMERDASRYLPILRDSSYVDSLWETKTVLPSSEADDSRPILLQRAAGLPNLTCIMGGKIDNIYDVLAELENRRSCGVAA